MVRDIVAELGPKAEFIQPAWIAAFAAALKNQTMLDTFARDTGNGYKLPRTALDRMIDDATGVNEAFIFSFARWFNANVWGEVEGRACNGDEPSIAALADEENTTK